MKRLLLVGLYFLSPFLEALECAESFRGGYKHNLANETLMQAITGKKVNLMEEALIEGADPTITDTNRNAVIHALAEVVNIENTDKVLNQFIQLGINIHAVNAQGNTAFHVASISNNALMLELLKDHGFDINVKDTVSNNSALHLAVKYNNLKITAKLFKLGVDPEITNSFGDTALHQAVLIEKSVGEHMVGLLIKNGVPVQQQNKRGHSVLHFVAKNPSPHALQIAQKLIKKGAPIHSRNMYEETALHAAAYHNNVLVARELIDADIDIHAVNLDQETALEVAIRRGHKPMVELLKKHGAQKQSKNLTELAARDLIVGIQKGNLQSVHKALEQGADSNAENSMGMRPLHYAIKNTKTSHMKQIILALLNDGAEIDAQNKHGSTALHQAVFYDNKQAAILLIQNGADGTLQNMYGETPSQFAFKRKLKWMHILEEASGQSLETILIHRRKMAQIIKKDDLKAFQEITEQHLVQPNDFVTVNDKPIHIAAFYGSVSILEFLLKNFEMDVNTRNTRHNTPIHSASQHNYANADNMKKSIQLLIKYGANVNVQNKKNETPLHSVAQNKNPRSHELIKIFADSQADFNAKNIFGETPLHLAVKVASKEMIETLLKFGALVHTTNNQGQNSLELAQKYEREPEVIRLLERYWKQQAI